MPSDSHRPTSTIALERRDGRDVYVKQYTKGPWNQSAEIIRVRAAREVEIIRRAAALPGMGGQLGVVRIVESDPDNARLVTEVVPGRELQECLLGELRARPEALRALELAGKWVRVFQGLPPDAAGRGPAEITDPVDYCDSRARQIQELGHRWPDGAERDDLLRRIRSLAGEDPGLDGNLVWCHCDYGPFNLIWDGGTLTPIDFARCRPDHPLADITYLIHHLEMYSMRSPWKRWPLEAWGAAVARGYGCPDVQAAPIYRVLMIRHGLAELLGILRYPGATRRARTHDAWMLRGLRSRVRRLAAI